MFSFGGRITDAGDRLRAVDLDFIYQQIKQPSAELSLKLQNLRVVYSIDRGRYNTLKRELPYVVAATFHPEYRRGENFASTEHFIVDLDHVGRQGEDVKELKRRLCADERVLMCFVSPGGDGLKLIFGLSEKCYDAGLYSRFYKLFVKDFAMRYNLETMIDVVTSDVCRACFLSHDPEVYYNRGAEKVDLHKIVNVESIFGEKSEPERPAEAKAEEKEPETGTKAETEKVERKNVADPDAEIMRRIKEQLQLSQAKAVSQKNFYVPAEINAVMEGVRQVIGDTGVTITEERDIQHGKQLFLACNLRRGAINIFFGRRGFSVVAMPRRGTSVELNDLMRQVVENHLKRFAY